MLRYIFQRKEWWEEARQSGRKKVQERKEEKRKKESICTCVGGGRCWGVCESLCPQLTQGELLRN